MDIVNRLKHFMDTQNIAISQFADTCQIPRPTMSQILNGRNKKISDELISKIHSSYPDLSILWLMFGEGEMQPYSNIKFSGHENAGNKNETSSNPAYFQKQNEEILTESENTSILSLSRKNLTDPLPPSTTSHPTMSEPDYFPLAKGDVQSAKTETTNMINFDALSDQTNTKPKESNETIDHSHTKSVKQTFQEKHITNIVVFYSDSSFQSFHPANFKLP